MKKYYICGMRIFIVVFLFLSVPVHASNFTIPQKFRGRYVCEVPSYEIKHHGISTKVEALTAVLLVYKTKIILRIGERSFPTNVERKVESRKNPVFQAEFTSPFQTCEITFNKKDKTVFVDLPIFQLLPFKKVK